MANWNKIGSRGNVFDRRASGPAAIGGGLGIGGLLLILALNWLAGGNVGDILSQLETAQVPLEQSFNAEDFEGADEYEVFASTVLGSNDEMWSGLFAESELRYTPPQLVLFRGATESACGGASSAHGPHYCPIDQTIYLDETFFDELRSRFGAQGGDVAEAYVISHEVGHHVQNQLGILQGAHNNQSSIKIELQADCFAGLWANSIRDLSVFEPNEIREAIDAAAAVGDDRVQEAVTGRVNPESWTHGSSAQRVEWFNKGFETGSVAECDAGR